MNNATEKTLELLNELPQANTVTAYGSGFFKQNTETDPKELDLIISVDNPTKWHKENMEMNPEMYTETGIEKQIQKGTFYDEKVSFPKSLSCFYPTYKGTEYKFLIVDKRLIYRDLENWTHFSLAGRFQKETKILVDNSNGILPNLMKQNYENAVKTALLRNSKNEIAVEDLYKNIIELSYLGDLRVCFHCEDPNKIGNIVEGSHDFIEDVYGCYLEDENGIVYKDDEEYSDLKLIDKIKKLPPALRNTLLNTLSDKQLENPKVVSKAINKYFKDVDFKSSTLLALRCYETVGAKRSVKTLTNKFQKGQKRLKK